jgi:ATP-dependent Clp protease ATP-binding subunit ClpC
MPDKAIDLIDEAGSRVRINNNTVPEPLKKASAKLDQIKLRKESAMKKQDYDGAADLRDEELRQEARTLKLKTSWEKDKDLKMEVTPDDIAEVVSMWTKIPVTRLGTEEKQRLLNMEAALTTKVAGQKDAIEAISKAVRRARSGLKNPTRPIGCFLFLGPTGVGKTHLVKKLSEFLFGSEDKMVRLDMSEYMERHTVARLIGSPPGYVGFEDGGQLTEAVRRNSYTTLLLDEIEKAHPDVFNILLQIFEDGFLTDSRGRRVDFKNTLIVMTSNLGSDLIRDDSILGFSNPSDIESNKIQYEKMKTKVLDEVKKFFKPEFLNRIDDIEVFHSLSKQHIFEIVDLLLNELQARVLDNGYVLQVTDDVRDYLVENGYDPKFGARPLRRLIQDEVENILSEEFLKDTYSPGDVIELDLIEKKIIINQLDKVNSNRDL